MARNFLFNWCHEEVDTVLSHIVTGDEMWIICCEGEESRCQEYGMKTPNIPCQNGVPVSSNSVKSAYTVVGFTGTSP
jgi:hypothetical protein